MKGRRVDRDERRAAFDPAHAERSRAEEDSPSRLLVRGKSNLSTPAPTLRFRAESRAVEGWDGEPIETVGLAWLGEAPNVKGSEVLTVGSAVCRGLPPALSIAQSRPEPTSPAADLRKRFTANGIVNT